MSITTTAQAALAAIAAAHSDLAVAVIIDGVSGTGLLVSEPQSTDFGPNGETGVTTGTVRVSKVAFTAKPERGATIKVGSDSVVVTNVDGLAMWVIQYRKVRPVAAT